MYFYSGTVPLFFHVGSQSLRLWFQWSLKLPQLLLWYREGSAISSANSLSAPLTLKPCHHSVSSYVLRESGGAGKEEFLFPLDYFSRPKRFIWSFRDVIFGGVAVVFCGCLRVYTVWLAYHFNTMCKEFQGCSIHPTDNAG